MSKNARLQEIATELRSANTLDWNDVRDRLHQEHEHASSEEDRVLCLALFTAMMDAVQSQVTEPIALDKLKSARRKDYNLFIVRESLAGTDVDPDKLLAITAREVTAGRMKPNHRLRVVALFGAFGVAPILDEHPQLYEALVAGGD